MAVIHAVGGAPAHCERQATQGAGRRKRADPGRPVNWSDQMSLFEILPLTNARISCAVIRRATKVGVAMFVILLVAISGSAAEKTREYETSAVRVRNHSATMHAHKNYYVTLVSGPVGKEGIPEVIKLGDKITVKDRSLTVKHIFVTEILEDMKWAGKVLGRKGDVTCTIVERLQDLPHVDENQWRNRLWIHVTECEPLRVAAKSFDSPQSSAQGLTCNSYGALAQNQKISLAYGYLEGVQAALDKEVTDILVPPSDSKHPMWWVLPIGLAENPFSGLAQRVDQHCQSAKNQHEGLLEVFLSIAYQKSGWPALGISFDKKKTDPWKRFLGQKESSVSCSAYNASPVETRQAIINGYYLGTEAIRVALKSSVDTGIVWPSKLSPHAVRLEVDKGCQKDKAATLRDVLWVGTAELGIQSR